MWLDEKVNGSNESDLEECVEEAAYEQLRVDNTYGLPDLHASGFSFEREWDYQR